jgi:hypothetical protein
MKTLLELIELIPNSKKLVAVLSIMLVGVFILDYVTWQYKESRLKERDRLIQETNDFIKAHRKPINTKYDVTL